MLKAGMRSRDKRHLLSVDFGNIVSDKVAINDDLKGHYGKYLALQIVLGFLLSQEQYT